jgi:hypothetical protein
MLNDLKWKKINYKVLSFVKHCNFGIVRAFIQGRLKKFKSFNFKNDKLKTNIWDNK